VEIWNYRQHITDKDILQKEKKKIKEKKKEKLRKQQKAPRIS